MRAPPLTLPWWASGNFCTHVWVWWRLTAELCSPEELEKALTVRFKRSYPFYAKRCLKIRQKSGETVPFVFNRSQQKLNEKIDDQIRRTGKVRLIILKSRQVGISTFLCGRSYYKTTFRNGFQAFVLTQDDDTTTNLFGMVKRFHDNVPDFVKPITGASNAKQLIFSRMDSGYLVSTAGNKATGRGHTIQIFHGSEVSRWPNAEEHVAGVLQAIPAAKGTEVYLESTADGINNLFHNKWKDAVRGIGEFEAIFIPWFWHEEYTRADAPADWHPPGEFAEYGALHDLTRGQMYWAYLKNIELAQSVGGKPEEICWKFRQEYPATAEEAFQTAGTNSFIRGDIVFKARRSKAIGSGPIILGVDVARGGDDKSALVDRQGRRLGGHICKKLDYGKSTTPLVGDIVRIVREMREAGNPIKKIVVDATGVGGPVYDLLRERLGEDLVLGIEFGGSALNKDRYANRRAEMWETMMQWFLNQPDVAIPDSDELQSDLCAPAWGTKDTGTAQMTRFRSDGTLIIEDKDHMRRRLKFSPDYGDAAALTFAVSFDELYAFSEGYRPPSLGAGAWMG
jgi:hypothetical protein